MPLATLPHRTPRTAPATAKPTLAATPASSGAPHGGIRVLQSRREPAQRSLFLPAAPLPR